MSRFAKNTIQVGWVAFRSEQLQEFQKSNVLFHKVLISETYEFIIKCTKVKIFLRYLKANVREKVLFSRTDFLPWEILLIKKLDFEKTKPT